MSPKYVWTRAKFTTVLLHELGETMELLCCSTSCEKNRPFRLVQIGAAMGGSMAFLKMPEPTNVWYPVAIPLYKATSKSASSEKLSHGQDSGHWLNKNQKPSSTPQNIKYYKIPTLFNQPKKALPSSRMKHVTILPFSYPSPPVLGLPAASSASLRCGCSVQLFSCGKFN